MPVPVLIDCVIPARNEEPTVAGVVAAARGCRHVREVIVVDDGSIDGTADVAAGGGAKVVRRGEGRGSKARAMKAGVDASDAEMILFVDADCVGLTAAHLDAICEPVLTGRAQMSLGTFDYGVLSNLVLRLPPLTGERVVPRWVFDHIPPDKLDGYTIEILINDVVARAALPISARVMHGVIHLTKRHKQGLVAGTLASWGMVRQLWKLWWLFFTRTHWFYLRNTTFEPPAGGPARRPTRRQRRRLAVSYRRARPT